RDGHLLGVAAERVREPAADALDVRLEDLPHVVDGGLIRDVEIALERLVHDAGARADAAVVQVDDGAIEGERLLDLAPVVLVVREILGRRPLDESSGRGGPREAVVTEARDGGRAGGAGGLQESASRQHAAALLEYVRWGDYCNRRRNGGTIRGNTDAE